MALAAEGDEGTHSPRLFFVWSLGTTTGALIITYNIVGVPSKGVYKDYYKGYYGGVIL